MGTHRLCPRCGGALNRIHRRPLDRLISRVYRVHRYVCRNLECGWGGLLHCPRERRVFNATGKTLVITVMLVALACLVVVTAVL